MQAEHEVDPGLGLPLGGVQLIEASAGTGKTFVLATLYARLVIEAKLPVSRVLAVTFTEAATKELRRRVRERLELAARLAGGEAPDASAEHQLTAQLVAAADEDRAALRRRLREAAAAMDLAPVHTIHVFCRRALADHALDAGYTPGELELIDNERALHEEVALELWRDCNRDAATLRALTAFWPTPAALAEGLRELIGIDALLPAVPLDAPDAEAAYAAMERAGAEVTAAFAAHGSVTKQGIDAALAADWMHGGRFRHDSVQKVWAVLTGWVGRGGTGIPYEDDDNRTLRVHWFGSEELTARSKQKFTPQVARLRNPLTDAIERWHRACTAAVQARTRRGIALVHALRARAIARLAELKRARRQQGFDDLIRGLAAALRNEATGPRLIARLRAQYAIALVDEFQDTDPEQWEIFRRVFADAAPRALFLIGDPKQAIYRFRGGDVYTYLEARRQAEAHWSLPRNFRSRPLALRAVQALFEGGGDAAFAQEGVSFVRVAPGDRATDDDFMLEGRVAPALTLLSLSEDAARVPDAETARDQATVAAVATIQALLQPGRAQLRDGAQRRHLRPGDIAVLTSTHGEAARVQRTLREAGVPCVATARFSLYESEQAQQLLCLIEALAHPGDEARARAALATPFIGLDAAALDALDRDPTAARRWQERLLQARQRWDRAGPLAAWHALCAEHAPRLLAQPDGEGVLARGLQLVEMLQGVETRDPVQAAQTLRRRIAQADARNEREWPRLASDEARVQIMTLHASKGLEFPIVLMPYLSHASAQAGRKDRRFARFHDGTQRVARLKDDDEDAWKQAKQREDAEREAEALRLLYVGLTRAKLATFVAFGPQAEAHKTALAWLLHGGRRPDKLDAPAIEALLATLAARAPDAIVLAPAPRVLAASSPRFVARDAPPAGVVRRLLSRDWRITSYSQLAHEDPGIDEGGAADEPEPSPVLDPTPFAGVRFGNALHRAFERARFERWRDLREDAPPPDDAPALIAALRGEGYAAAGDLDAGATLLASLIRRTLNARLPEGARLCDLPDSARRAELEFHFSLRATSVPELLALLHRYEVLPHRQGFGTWSRLEGLMTGAIDLVYVHAGRYYLADYKSNRLPAYDAGALAQAMRDSEYDLQALLYALALHRWLRFRRGAAYRYERDFGGVRYLFCRGIEADGAGVYAARPEPALIHALDALFGAAA